MKFLSVAIAGTISTFIMGGTALPLPASTLSLPNEQVPDFHIGIPDPVPEDCGLHCPAIAKRSSTLEPIDESYLETRHMGGFGGAPGGGSPGGAPGGGFGGPRMLPRFGGGPGGFSGAPNGGFGGQGGFSGPSRIFPRFGFGGMGGHGGAPGGFGGGNPGGFGHGMMKRFISTAMCARSYLTGGCCGVCPIEPLIRDPIEPAVTPVAKPATATTTQ